MLRGGHPSKFPVTPWDKDATERKNQRTCLQVAVTRMEKVPHRRVTRKEKIHMEEAMQYIEEQEHIFSACCFFSVEGHIGGQHP